ncbi:hypothetical protein BP6252_13940 [Coleophoma cylindrospora]|uniref:Heterokaryon incompatibility domain-containing protein n=1 Tax=Coleophoma cylindrospora TaxID=1849047 RepID=A0A3D8Q5N1_9HELO|nr:hypothetical protein BP6252_13940 [Coleophoma cylindrospora]
MRPKRKATAMVPPDAAETIPKRHRKELRTIPECNLCLELIRLAGLPLEDAVYELKVGKYDELRLSSCTTHSPIIAKCDMWAKCSIWQGEIGLTKQPFQRSVQVLVDYHSVLTLTRLPGINCDSGTSPGKLLQPQWIEPGLLALWRKKCHDLHGASCSGPRFGSQMAASHPRLLIDTWRMCITEASAEHSYVALSYVWGGYDQLKTSKANLDRLKEENALQQPDFLSRIPQTILDAIHLVKGLERYLWVDSLCIIQDDEASKHVQIRENADYGLRGIQDVSQPRDFSQEVYHILGEQSFVHSPPFPLSESVWVKRGWTLQESLLSQKKVFFCGDRVQWQCSRAFWDEEIKPDDLVIPISERPSLRYTAEADMSALLTSPWPDFEGYAQLVSTFCTKELTYPEDILSAFYGFSYALSTIFRGGFIFGIPNLFFDVGLLWVGDGKLGCRPGSLPSWSWMGWSEHIDTGFWGSACQNVKLRSGKEMEPSTSMRTIPLVQWSCSDSPDSPKRPIAQTTPEENIEKDHVPAGWTRKPHSPHRQFKMWGHQTFDKKGEWTGHVSGSCQLREPAYHFTHVSDPTTEFWYPIPLQDPKEPPIIQTQSPVLSCTTKRAFFKLGGQMDLYEWKVSLHTNSGAWAGCLELHNSDQIDYSDSPEKILPGPGDCCELVAISMGFAYNDWAEYRLAEWEMAERPKKGEKYEFYNVLWIEWQDGIASRKGLGRVHKPAWEQQELETIELILR